LLFVLVDTDGLEGEMKLCRGSLLGILVLGCFGTFVLPAHLARSANLAPDLQRYVGTWQGQFKGTTFVILKLREQDSKLGRTVVHATHVQADPNGDLLAVDVRNAEDKIVETRTEKGKLIFKVSESADNDSLVQCELTITAKDAGQLQIVVPAPGRQFKPWKVDRTSQTAG
jgi:hypothetical protein